jgi:hypothetical protein
VRIRWYDSENQDETKSVTVTSIVPVSNRFTLNTMRDGYDLCLNLYALTTSIPSDQISPTSPKAPTLHIDITR